MKKFFRIFLLTIFFISSQNIVWTQKDIKSKITKNHVLVKGTKLRIIPPAGFVDGTKFNGFQNPSTEAVLIVVGMPVGFTKSIEGVSKDILEKQGLTNIVFKNIKVNSMPGLYITGQQSIYGLVFEKNILFFGNDKESVAINTTHNVKNIEEGESLMKSINSIYLDEKVIIDPFANLDYYFSQPTLKFAKVVNTSIVYNIDGILPTKAANSTSLIASKATLSYIIEDRNKFAKERLAKFNINIDSIDSVKDMMLDGLAAIQIIASGKEKGATNPSKFYQLIIFDEKAYYITFGATHQDFEKNLPLVINMSQSFLRKK